MDRKFWVSAGLATALVLASWYAGLVVAPTESAMGEVYRILYLHVPSAFAAFVFAAILFGLSIWALRSRTETPVRWMKASAEVGFLFTIICLMTGSIWGKPTWGTWWTWDARLTTTFVLALLYAGFLLLHSTMEPGMARHRALAVLGILIFADVPIIYKSVTWWRTLHQPTDIIDRRGANMDADMLQILIFCVLILIAYGVWMMVARAKNLALAADVESASFEQLK